MDGAPEALKASAGRLPDHKTRIVATIGPASSVARGHAGADPRRDGRGAAELLARRLRVARPRDRRRSAPRPPPRAASSPSWPTCRARRCASAASSRSRCSSSGRCVHADHATTSSETRSGASVTFARLPQVVKPGDQLFLNDGIIQLEVERVDGRDVRCRVVVGGELRSRKGLNLPGIDLGISRVHRARPRVPEVRARARRRRRQPVVRGVGGGHRGRARRRRGARGASVRDRQDRARRRPRPHSTRSSAPPTASWSRAATSASRCRSSTSPIVQKDIIHRANVAGQTGDHRHADARVDGDAAGGRRAPRPPTSPTRSSTAPTAVMLSGESAMGDYPVEAVAMLSRIAAATEPHRSRVAQREALRTYGHTLKLSEVDLVAISVARVFEGAAPAAVFVPTISGDDGAQHRPLPPAGLGRGRQPARGDVPGSAALLRRHDRAPAGRRRGLERVRPRLARRARDRRRDRAPHRGAVGAPPRRQQPYGDHLPGPAVRRYRDGRDGVRAT